MFLSARLNFDWYFDPRPGAGLYTAGWSDRLAGRRADISPASVPPDRAKHDAPLRETYENEVQGATTINPLQRATQWLSGQVHDDERDERPCPPPSDPIPQVGR